MDINKNEESLVNSKLEDLWQPRAMAGRCLTRPPASKRFCKRLRGFRDGVRKDCNQQDTHMQAPRSERAWEELICFRIYMRLRMLVISWSFKLCRRRSIKISNSAHRKTDKKATIEQGQRLQKSEASSTI